ncbi:HlyD family type I secretion periplasmic adaptor subunit [Alsobacter soli]|uniref:Membrane fusion protein (MFP) family protein n=1 Tax=Alsobacter soli TaxID=2109933 RepID=A0A2T1HQK7_9HYPH|nr:HlyD family type I secretion periplasmic adaptor subunit [Alsobacter soli]PSC03926.1 HlyD family type I secretion periplasmic adaptor subunit [Alsobacter soli]
MQALPAYKALGRNMRAGLLASAMLVLGAGGLTAFTPITGAVIAQGALVVESSPKKVQHPQGGVVQEIRVKEGDHVQAGDVLLRLDETVARASLAVVSNSLDQDRAKAARMAAELAGMPLSFPADLLHRAKAEPDIAELLAGEAKLYAARAVAREGERKQLRERIAQAGQEIAGYESQEAAKARESALISKELDGVRELYAKKLVSIGRVNQLERDAARLEGDRGQLRSAMARTKGQIAETEIQILQIDQKLKGEVAAQLRETQAKIAEEGERQVAAKDTLNRIEMRAPQSGVVNQMTVHTVGGVVQPNETVMMIVPERETLVAEVKVRPNEASHVYEGQPASVLLTGLDRNVTPRLNGTVRFVGSDAVVDPRQGASYFVARIGFPDSERARLAEDVKIGAGMPVETFLATGDRTLLSYLVKPIADQMRRAFR